MAIIKKVNYLMLLIYSTAFFSVLGIGYRTIVALISLWAIGEFAYDWHQVVIGLKMAVVASFAVTLAAFIFNKIDEYNARKKPPSDPDK
ncbi:hypothetical protein [Ewingella americana]|uniref:Uncharacterized protein n=1 Tax=Ewingella americana TaxID=41202 RepID=A0A502G0U5_9GAMM|nr:hypothetical protein [Ewingella americana]TPG55389.1 hypothetical protein EAH77_23470 [Ewingella americana]